MRKARLAILWVLVLAGLLFCSCDTLTPQASFVNVDPNKPMFALRPSEAARYQPCFSVTNRADGTWEIRSDCADTSERNYGLRGEAVNLQPIPVDTDGVSLRIRSDATMACRILVVYAPSGKTLYSQLYSVGATWEALLFPLGITEPLPEGSLLIHVIPLEQSKSIYLKDVAVYDQASRNLDREEEAVSVPAHRARTVVVQTQNEMGEPVPGAEVLLFQARSGLRLGGRLNLRLMAEESLQAKEYVSYFNALFEYADVLRWQDKGGVPEEVVKLGDKGIRFHGGSLSFPTAQRYQPESWSKLDENELLRAMEEQLLDQLAFTLPFARSWDIAAFVRDGGGYSSPLGQRILPVWLREVRLRIPPEGRLSIRESRVLTGAEDVFEAFLRDIRVFSGLEQLDELRLETHFSARSKLPAEVLKQRLDQLAQLGVDIALVNLSFDGVLGTTDPGYVRRVMEVIYGHPSVTEMVLGDWWSGDATFPENALLDNRFQPTPLGVVVLEKWLNHWQADFVARTDAQGRATLRIREGTYQAVANHKDLRAVMRFDTEDDLEQPLSLSLVAKEKEEPNALRIETQDDPSTKPGQRVEVSREEPPIPAEEKQIAEEKETLFENRELIDQLKKRLQELKQQQEQEQKVQPRETRRETRSPLMQPVRR